MNAGATVPDDLKMPQFSSDFDERRFCLNATGLRALISVLTAIALEFPGTLRAPPRHAQRCRRDVLSVAAVCRLPVLALDVRGPRAPLRRAALLTTAQTFACCAAMLVHHQCIYTTRMETWSMLEAFRDLVQARRTRHPRPSRAAGESAQGAHVPGVPAVRVHGIAQR